MVKMDTLIEIYNKINESNQIIITSHVNPDGDAIGAGLGLLLSIKKIMPNKNIRFVLQDDYPQTVKFLKEINLVEKYNENLDYHCDLMIFVDSAATSRTGATSNLSPKAFIINIDHHVSNPNYGDINYVDYISSTSEIIYDFIKVNNIPLDTDIGECLYTGLINDTGNFKHSNVTKKTFYMAGDLIENGVDNSKIVREFLENKSYAATKLIGGAMYKMEFFEEEKLAYYYLSYKEMSKYNGKKEDTESIVERLIDYNEADLSFFLREEESGGYKGSLRSKTVVDVNQIAALFGGGGHKMAAGFSSDLSEEQILEKVLDFLEWKIN